jgi:ribosome-associated translation inhibitor RaiA
MHIEVLGDDSISQQARTYAEYRVFAALSRLVDTDRVRCARLILRRTTSTRACDGVLCTVTVDIKDGESLRVRTSGDHPYAAINRAVERLAEGGWRSSAGDHSRVAHAIAE